MVRDIDKNNDESFRRFVEFIAQGEDIYKYLHNTESKHTADKILKEGFDFESHLDHTTDMVTGKDPIEIKYFIITRKRYGLYTILIEIAKSTVDDFSKKLRQSNYHFSEVLTLHESVIGENDEPVYRLPRQFIKGYYDHASQTEVLNKYFDPYFHSSRFDDNLRQILG
jgi:hypothetical protein